MMKIIKTQFLRQLEAMAEDNQISDPPPSIYFQSGVSEYAVDRRTMRAFVLNKARIDYRGREIDANGVVIEDENWEILPGRNHEQWPLCRYEYMAGSKVLSLEEYETLPEERTNGWIKCNFIEVDNLTSLSRSKLDRSDREILKEILREDISTDPRIAAAYFVAAKRGQSVLSFLDTKEVILSVIPQQ